MNRLLACLLSVAVLSGVSWTVLGEEISPVDPGPNRADEPAATEFSLERAVDFLDSASLTWQSQRKCFTCHTNYAYLYARPLVSSQTPGHAAIRAAAEQLVLTRWPEKGPRWDAEVIATAAALAFNDRATSGKLHSTTLVALDRMWTVQHTAGGWNWLKCGWPPMESDDHYGACLAALAVALAGPEYRASEAAQAGVAKLKTYLAQNPPPTTHHEAMLLWAASRWQELITAEQRQAIVDKLWQAQNSDGGWSLASLGDWVREDGSPQDKHSDGYGTGFVIYVLRQAGISAADARIQAGLTWLKTHQRASGRWFTRSLHKDGRHFITHAGTAYAVMAISSCTELPAAR